MNRKIVFKKKYFGKKSVHGTCNYINQECFFKIKSKKNALREKNYSERASKFFPNPKILGTKKYPKKQCLIYPYEKSPLLIDLIMNCEKTGILTKKNKKSINQIMKIWKKAFLKRKISSEKSPSDELFKKRVKERLMKWYSRSKIKNLVIELNKNPPQEIKRIIYETEKYFRKNKEKLKIFSQGDPHSMNISTKPLFFDFEYSGLNDFNAEISIFIWAIFAQEGYFFPRYEKTYFNSHLPDLKSIQKNSPIEFDYTIKKNYCKVKLDYSPSKIRKYILQEYFKKIISPIIKKYPSEKAGLKYYLAMRILGVSNLNKMNERDKILALSMLVYFWDLESLKYDTISTIDYH